MKRFKNILVATDTRLDSQVILNTAAEVAVNNNASLRIVDIVPDLSWATRLTLQDHQHVQDLLRKEKQQNLESLAAPIREQGISVETKLLEGKSSVEIVREAIRGEHDLVVAVAKGNNSRHSGFFGHTARRLLRHCPTAVWLVAPEMVPQVKHVLACVDTSTDNSLDAELNDKVYELASSISTFQNSKLSVLHAWLMQDESLLSARLKPPVVEQYVTREREHREKLLDKFLQQHESSRSSENVHMVKGSTSEVVSNFVRDNAVDLVVMGTVARSGLTGMLMGNTSEEVLDQISCSVLAVKPYSFKTPIKA
ncbi:MAG: universal stress protein [Pirellulaceae bacterium]